MKRVAVTGIIACGKSTVCQRFKELGAYVASADEIVHQLLNPNTEIGQKVIDLLGIDVVVNHQFDKKSIAYKVFSDKSLLTALEKILHPAVREEIDKRYRQAQLLGKESLFVAEIPLLFEGGFYSDYDLCIVVVSDKATCKKRFIEKTKSNPDEFDKRMARQFSQEEKAAQADLLIYNDGSLEDLKKVVDHLFKQLTASSGKRERKESKYET